MLSTDGLVKTQIERQVPSPDCTEITDLVRTNVEDRVNNGRKSVNMEVDAPAVDIAHADNAGSDGNADNKKTQTDAVVPNGDHEQDVDVNADKANTTPQPPSTPPSADLDTLPSRTPDTMVGVVSPKSELEFQLFQTASRGDTIRQDGKVFKIPTAIDRLQKKKSSSELGGSVHTDVQAARISSHSSNSKLSARRSMEDTLNDDDDSMVSRMQGSALESSKAARLLPSKAALKLASHGMTEVVESPEPNDAHTSVEVTPTPTPTPTPTTTTETSVEESDAMKEDETREGNKSKKSKFKFKTFVQRWFQSKRKETDSPKKSKHKSLKKKRKKKSDDDFETTDVVLGRKSASNESLELPFSSVRRENPIYNTKPGKDESELEHIVETASPSPPKNNNNNVEDVYNTSASSTPPTSELTVTIVISEDKKIDNNENNGQAKGFAYSIDDLDAVPSTPTLVSGASRHKMRVNSVSKRLPSKSLRSTKSLLKTDGDEKEKEKETEKEQEKEKEKEKEIDKEENPTMVVDKAASAAAHQVVDVTKRAAPPGVVVRPKKCAPPVIMRQRASTSDPVLNATRRVSAESQYNPLSLLGQGSPVMDRKDVRKSLSFGIASELKMLVGFRASPSGLSGESASTTRKNLALEKFANKAKDVSPVRSPMSSNNIMSPSSMMSKASPMSSDSAHDEHPTVSHSVWKLKQQLSEQEAIETSKKENADDEKKDNTPDALSPENWDLPDVKPQMMMPSFLEEMNLKLGLKKASLAMSETSIKPTISVSDTSSAEETTEEKAYKADKNKNPDDDLRAWRLSRAPSARTQAGMNFIEAQRKTFETGSADDGDDDDDDDDESSPRSILKKAPPVVPNVSRLSSIRDEEDEVEINGSVFAELASRKQDADVGKMNKKKLTRFSKSLVKRNDHEPEEVERAENIATRLEVESAQLRRPGTGLQSTLEEEEEEEGDTVESPTTRTMTHQRSEIVSTVQEEDEEDEEELYNKDDNAVEEEEEQEDDEDED